MIRRCVCLLALALMSFVTVKTQNCSSIQRDLVILLDSSGSVAQADFEKAKKFLASFINELEVSDKGYQVAVIRFSDSLRGVAGLGAYNGRKTELMTKVLNIFHNGGGTAIDRALGFALATLDKNNRVDAPDQILILTDGKSDDTKATVGQIEAVRAKNVEMISIGVGKGVNDVELRNLASSDKLMFKVDSYADLNNIKSKLIVTSCGVTIPTPTTPTTATTTTRTTTLAKTTEDSTTLISIYDVTDILRSFFNTTADLYEADTTEAVTDGIEKSDAVTEDNLNRDSMNAGLREKRGMLSSASGTWKKVTGLTVGAFALTALTSGLIVLGVSHCRKTRRKHYLETL